MKIPNSILRQLYTFGSLAHSATGVRFSLKNRLSDATVTAVKRVAVDEEEVDLGRLTLASTVTRSGLGHFASRNRSPSRSRRPSSSRHPGWRSPRASTRCRSRSTPSPSAIRRSRSRTRWPPMRRARRRCPTTRKRTRPPEIIKARQGFLSEEDRRRRWTTCRTTRSTRDDPRERREFHGRGAGAHRVRRTAARQRRTRPGRVLHPAGDHGRHARRVLQPRDEDAEPVWWRDVHGRGRLHAARPRVRVRLGA